MTPLMPSPSTAHRASMSGRPVSPPLAMTGTRSARATRSAGSEVVAGSAGKLDGEVAAVLPTGATSFQALQRRAEGLQPGMRVVTSGAPYLRSGQVVTIVGGVTPS